MRFDLAHESAALVFIYNVQHLLHNVVGILVFHHCHEWARSGEEKQRQKKFELLASLTGTHLPVRSGLKHLFNQNLTVLFAAIVDAFLDDVAREFVLAELQHLTMDFFNNNRFVLGSTALQDMLNDIVAILVLDELARASVKLIQQRSLEPCGCFRSLSFHCPYRLEFSTVLKHALDHSATIGMRCQIIHLTVECVNDKLDMLRRNTLNGLEKKKVRSAFVHSL